MRGMPDYADTTPTGRLLQEMIAGTPQADAARSKRVKIEELEAAVRLSTIPSYFPTPPELARMMCEIADLEPEASVLEPSAGNGNIADAIVAACPTVQLDVCEINSNLAEILKLKGHNLVFQTPDFMDMESGPFAYDRILMNPPFERNQDILHVMHAYNMLSASGVLVAIMSPHFEFANDSASRNFRKWLEDVGASWDEIPAGAFQKSGTMVASRIVVIDKRQENENEATH